MKTIFNPATRSAIVSRIGDVSSGARPKWGKMNSEEMLTHLINGLRMAIGELSPRPKKLPIRYTPLRQLIVYLAPWPRNAPTAPELLPSNPVAIEEAKRELLRLIEDVGGRGAQREWPEHPAFGPLGRRGWGVVVWKHLDHHLRQFGV